MSNPFVLAENLHDIYQQYLHTAFAAEGRIGGVATGQAGSYELDVGPSLANPASTSHFPWDCTEASKRASVRSCGKNRNPAFSETSFKSEKSMVNARLLDSASYTERQGEKLPACRARSRRLQPSKISRVRGGMRIAREYC